MSLGRLFQICGPIDIRLLDPKAVSWAKSFGFRKEEHEVHTWKIFCINGGLNLLTVLKMLMQKGLLAEKSVVHLSDFESKSLYELV